MKKVLLLLILDVLSLQLRAQHIEVLPVSQLPVQALDSTFFKFVPTVDYDTLMQRDGETSFTTDYQASGSIWGDSCNELDVYLARLKHSAGIDDSWDLRIGKGGQIYSFIGPYGEGVPPSSKSTSRWNDEVWQPVSVSSEYNNSDAFEGVKSMKYFIHGAGNYINEETQKNTFYSPLMASYYDKADGAYYVTNWGQQAHVPSLYKSGVLYTTKYRDIGEGVLEVTYVIQNFGEDIQDHLNMPWGGVRSSNLRGQFYSTPDNNIHISNANTGTQAGLLDIDETGGFFIFAKDTLSASSPSLGLVFGSQVLTDDFSDHNLSRIYFRFAQVGGDTNPRDYSLFVLIPKIKINPGETFYYRMYYINGNRDFVRQKSIELVPFTEYGFIHTEIEQAPVVRIETSDFFNAFSQDINLFSSPMDDMVPLFLMENAETGEQYISPDLYYNVTTEPFINPYSPTDDKYETYQNRYVNRPYDGKVKYIRMLGYGVSRDMSTANIRFVLLDSLVQDDDKLVLTDEYKGRVWVPVEFCDGCNIDTVADPDDGLMIYNDFNEVQNAIKAGEVAVTYTSGVANPNPDAVNSDTSVAKVVRTESIHANLRFDLPTELDLSEVSDFKLKAYFESSEKQLPANCKISIILRHSDTGGTVQHVVHQDITAMNEWLQLEYDCSGAKSKGPFNQVWLFFSMGDATGETAGQTFYIDELKGPSWGLTSPVKMVVAEVGDKKVKVSPNPVQNHISLGVEPSKVEVYNIYGVTMLNSNANNQSIDVSHICSGVYCLRVWDKNGKSYTGCFIKR